MADQTTMNRRDGQTVHVGENLAELVHDMVTLAELQVQLLAVDVRDARRNAGPALGRILVGGVLALGGLPVLLLAAGQLLMDSFAWSAGGAYAAVGAIAAVLGSALVVLGWRRTARALATVQRSRSEFVETLRWLKESLRPASRQDGETSSLRF